MKPHDALNLALSMTAAGLSIVPPAEDGTKKPFGAWAPYQKRIVGDAQLRSWYASGKLQGFGAVCGEVSGGLECIDFDDMDLHKKAKALAEQDPGLGYLVTKIENGYCEKTPKGYHWLYRCTEIDRSKKLARIKKEDKYYAIETRGEGGYVIIAPTSSEQVNKKGKYSLVSGGHDTIATITPEERTKLHDALRSLDEEHGTRTVFKPMAIPEAGEQNQNRPGDDYNSRMTWEELLIPAGWSVFGQRGDVTDWCKPGCQGDHAHATTGYGGSDIFYCFSSAAPPFDPEESYSKFAVYTMLHHNGDFEEASCSLRDQGYGAAGPDDLPAYQKRAKTSIEKVLLKNKVDAETVMDRSKDYGFLDLSRMDLKPAELWLDWMPAGGLIILAGAPKIGKSWFCLELCACIIADNQRRVMGEFNSAFPEGASVLYLALEDGEHRIMKRGLEVIKPPLRFHEHVPKQNWNRLRMMHEHPPLDREGLEKLHQYLVDNPSVKVVILDTIQTLRPSNRRGANAYESDYQFYRSIKSIADLHRVTCIAITHLRKGGNISGDPLEQISGSSAVPGAADATWMLSRARGGDSDSSIAKFHVTGRDFEEQTYTLKFMNGRWRYSEAMESFHVTESQSMILEALEEMENGGKPGDIKRWMLDRNLAVPSSLYNMLNDMTSRKVLNKNKVGRYIINQKYLQSATERDI